MKDLSIISSKLWERKHYWIQMNIVKQKDDEFEKSNTDRLITGYRKVISEIIEDRREQICEIDCSSTQLNDVIYEYSPEAGGVLELSS